NLNTYALILVERKLQNPSTNALTVTVIFGIYEQLLFLRTMGSYYWTAVELKSKVCSSNASFVLAITKPFYPKPNYYDLCRYYDPSDNIILTE
ncbi:4941_t:CDS:2, partial [Ambispora leptoticha]